MSGVSIHRNKMDLVNSKKQKNPGVFSTSIVFFCALVEMVFVRQSLSVFLGPIILSLLCYFYFIKEEKIFAVVCIVMGNDALGTIFFGQLSFQYLLILFIGYELLNKPKIRVRYLVLAIVAIIIVLQALLTDAIKFRAFLFNSLFVVALIIQYANSEREVFVEKLSSSIAIMVVLVSVHVLITGGVVFYDMKEEYQRRGILGVGIGDPNFSALILCTGLACIINNKKIHWIPKVVMALVVIGAMFVTLSTLGVVAFSVVCFCSVVINRHVSKWFFVGVAVILLLVYSFVFYVNLPDKYHIADLDEYIDRITEKIELLNKGDYEEATTKRSKIAKNYMNYINNEQPYFKKLFGGNSVFYTGGVPHNTYIDTILRFGYIGFILAMIYIIIRMFKSYLLPWNSYRKHSLTLKLLYLVSIFSLSVYDGSTFALLYVFFCVL